MKYSSKAGGKKPVQIGLNVKAARLDLDMSQEELAETVHMPREHISRIESGSNSKIETYYKIAEEGLNMAFEELAAYHLKHKKH